MPDILDVIQKDIHDNKVMLYMKGSAEAPQCGFSAQVVSILKNYGVPFKSKDVLADPALRQGIKDFAGWPTIPQLYINGEFIGGCDIVTELHTKNELASLLKA